MLPFEKLGTMPATSRVFSVYTLARSLPVQQSKRVSERRIQLGARLFARMLNRPRGGVRKVNRSAVRNELQESSPRISSLGSTRGA